MPPKAATEASSHGLTDGELKLALAMMKHIDRPTTDVLEKMASEAGLASASSARTLLGRAATKHGWFSGGVSATAGAEDGGTPAAAASTPRPKKTPTPRKKKISEVEEAAEEEGTPTKKRGRKTKAQKAAEEAAAAEAAAAATAQEAATQEDEDMQEDGNDDDKVPAVAADGDQEQTAEQK
ncbi:hypothetical protein CORC01_00477 [Colletotrichum orchidophilum]|uniref:Uncharacterized protein n=1 Tax=Colletotrichum orchidophilum TaxID=1209926 RepID=A0A1G4BRW0_9PEZI|nr:uncharacterized protein CORC01_00477 [Colletotrichum orchidophilum]OHF04138.1 hypothetical protein CORC01_00477 [Colletotrichum orchidophilum]